MNLLISARLDGAQKEVIQELTLKKRQSKKSTMSERQLAARQQLARELMQERKQQTIYSSTNNNNNNNNNSISSCNSGSFQSCNNYGELSFQSISQDAPFDSPFVSAAEEEQLPHRRGIEKTIPLDCADSTPVPLVISSSLSRTQEDEDEAIISQVTSCKLNNSELTPANKGACVTPTSTAATPTLVHVRQLNQSLGSSGSSCCSFSRSDSSYSGTSQQSCTSTNSITLEEGSSSTSIADSNRVAHLMKAKIIARKKEANIKFNKIRLDHLNDELERRLHQYEYLVEQEKALLGSYNMVLFTNEGVNNFHLHQSPTFSGISGTTATIRRNQSRQEHKGSAAQRNPSAASSISSSTASSTGSSSSGADQQAANNKGKGCLQDAIRDEQRKRGQPQLNSSASTVSNLNTLHMHHLPAHLAAPKRSASSVALITINQGQVCE